MTSLRGRALVAHQAHNLKVVGSIPAPATNDFLEDLRKRKSFFCPPSGQKKLPALPVSSQKASAASR